MQNPSDLYRFETDAPMPTREPGALIVLLGAFIDAGNIQRILGTHLVDSSDAEVVATFDVDALIDYRGRRPAMVFDTNRWESYADPSMVLYRMRDRDGQTYYLLTGPEPDFQWERTIEAIRQLIQILGINLVVTSHGIPMGVPHTRPVGMTAHATNPRLVGGKESPFGQVQVPASFPALLELRLGEAGRDALGFAIHVPQYLAQAEWAEGALAALNAITDATGLNLPNDDLIAKAGVNNREIASELAENADAGQIVNALEQQYDAFVEGQERPSLLATEAQDLPSADELGADIEEFLRNVSDD
ncbi:PAC2 family protein [Knoellia subterranea]|uniref:Proteasome assembly chaperone 2 n=1 Tax=Knoellia subterranea KCTC 19937 TaxID=1385521 RepID=A0A0A0JJT0_9MICO|nr:PAC2 family protein [Knoellia subterranea]KGN36312.1 proteasome assembly chaperone 2 [Knoellia subterranea KCTC 19937]